MLRLRFSFLHILTLIRVTLMVIKNSTNLDITRFFIMNKKNLMDLII